MGHITASGSSISMRFALVLGGALALSGCQADLPDFLSSGGASTTGADSASARSRSVERDVEAPEVFHVADKGLWDGRPSLGGVWVAHPDVRDPERVIIRNQANGKFVIGVVYRPERTAPGPKFQVSSDAAKALAILAGQPTELDVTALRREETPAEPPATDAAGDTASDAAGGAAGGEVKTATLDPIATASQALDAAESKPAVPASALVPTASKPASKPAAAAAPAPAASSLRKPFVQIGIFSVKDNATQIADRLRGAGMVPTVKEGATSGKKFWRVLVGPATSSAERSALLKKIKGLGFADAYTVSN